MSQPQPRFRSQAAPVGLDPATLLAQMATFKRPQLVRLMAQQPDNLPAPASLHWTHQPPSDPAFDALPANAQALFLELYPHAMQAEAAALKPLEELVAAYPEVHTLRDTLTNLALALGQPTRFLQLCLKAQQDYPDYLFPRLIQAKYHAHRGEWSQVEAVLEGQLDLPALQPQASYYATDVRLFYEVAAGLACQQHLPLRALYALRVLHDLGEQVLDLPVQERVARMIVRHFTAEELQTFFQAAKQERRLKKLRV